MAMELRMRTFAPFAPLREPFLIPATRSAEMGSTTDGLCSDEFVAADNLHIMAIGNYGKVLEVVLGEVLEYDLRDLGRDNGLDLRIAAFPLAGTHSPGAAALRLGRGEARGSQSQNLILQSLGNHGLGNQGDPFHLVELHGDRPGVDQAKIHVASA